MRNSEAIQNVSVTMSCFLFSLLFWYPSSRSSSFVANGFVAPSLLFTQRTRITDNAIISIRQQKQDRPRAHNSKFGLHDATSRIRQTTETASSSSDEKQQRQKSPKHIEIVEVFEDHDDLDGDGDTDDLTNPARATARQPGWVEKLKCLAQTSSWDATAADQADAILDRMLETYSQTDDSTYLPTVEVYNLLLETHAYSRNDQGAVHAETILSRMEDPSHELIAPPNARSYLNVMDAWAMRREPEMVHAVLDRQRRRYAETNDEAVRPSVDGQNKLIKAYGIVGDVETAESIFRSLLLEDRDDVESHDDDSEEYRLKADHKSWVQLMKAYVAIAGKTEEQHHQKEAIEKVQSLFREMQRAYQMGEEDYQPRTEAFNSLIKAVGMKQGKEGPHEAEALMFEMIDRFRNKGDEVVKPNAETFRHVMAAYKGRGHWDGSSTAAKVEQILQIQEGFLSSDGDHGKRDDNTFDERIYYSAMNIIARSKDPKKAMRINRIVDKFKQNIANGGKARMSGPLYYNQIMACAYTDGTPEENFQAFQIAISALKELQQLPEKDIGSSSMGMFLKACNNLMPPSNKRDAVAKSVFKDCCKKGLVNNFVITEFGQVASESLQLEVLGAFVEDGQEGLRIPKDWCRNVN